MGPGDHSAGEGSIWLASILGGKPRKLRGGAYRAQLSPDDSLIAYMRPLPGTLDQCSIWLADANGEKPRELVTAEPTETLGSPAWSADGNRVFYRKAAWSKDGMVTTIESRGLDDPTSTVLVKDPKPTGKWKDDTRIWQQDFTIVGDRLIYSQHEKAPRSRDENLWELTIDPDRGQPRGEPRRLTDWAGFSVSELLSTADGSQLAFKNHRTQEDVYVGELREGGWTLDSPRRLTLDERDDQPSLWMPDGSILFLSDRYGSNDLFVQGLDDRTARDFVVGAGDRNEPHLAPDRASILYWEAREEGGGESDRKRLMRVPVGGGPTEVVLEAQGGARFDCAIRPDGLCLLAEGGEDGNAIYSRLDPVEGKGEELFRRKFEGIVTGTLSPDGSQLALLVRDESQAIQMLNSLTGELIRDIPIQGAADKSFFNMAWSADGEGVYLIADDLRGNVLTRVDLLGNAKVLLETPTADLVSVTPSLDGRHLAFGQATWDVNVWMIENF